MTSNKLHGFINIALRLNLISHRSYVRIVSSNRSGMGKSLYIQRLAEDLQHKLNNPDAVVHVTIPLHGPVVTSDTVLELLKDHLKNQTCCIYHIDIAPNVSTCISMLYPSH